MCTSSTEQPGVRNRENMDKYIKIFLAFLQFVIIQVHWILDCIIDFIFGIYYNGKSQRVPPVKNKLLLESALSLAKKIRKKEISSEELVRAFIERCKEVNGLLNAIVEERYEDAISEAKEIDNMLRNYSGNLESLEKTKPLLGLPFTTKESNTVKGMLHSMGMVCRKGYRAPEDAAVIQNVKNAGAILIGKTNIPEMNLWVESRNNVYGQTNNPYDTTRSVGGSSGGDGAIVTACGVPFAVGSDIGGSIRIPALCNGVFGFKPSQGLTSLKGIGLRENENSESMAEAGPICKMAEDIEFLMNVIAGSRLNNPINSSAVNLKHLNIFYQESTGDIRASKVSLATHAALMKAVRHMEQVTCSSLKITIPGTEYSYRLWRYWMTQEDCNFKSDITNRQGCANAYSEIFKLITNSCNLTLSAIFKLVDLDIFPQENEEWARNITDAMKSFLLEKLGSNGVLLFPSMNSATYHHAIYLKPFNFGVTALFNVLKLPTCQVPMGLDDKRLPIGIQVVAGPNNDKLCIAVAKELEKAFGGWVAPS